MGFLDSIPFFRRNQAEAAGEATPGAEPAEAPAPTEEAAPSVVVADPNSVAAVDPNPVAIVAAPSLAPAAPSPTARAAAEELVRSVVQELPGFVTVAVVERVGGRILAGQWAGHSGGAVEAAAANAEIVNQTYQALAALQLGPDEQLQDIVITLTQQLHLLRVMPQQPWLLYLAVRTQDTNLALARTVLQGFA